MISSALLVITTDTTRIDHPNTHAMQFPHTTLICPIFLFSNVNTTGPIVPAQAPSSDNSHTDQQTKASEQRTQSYRHINNAQGNEILSPARHNNKDQSDKSFRYSRNPIPINDCNLPHAPAPKRQCRSSNCPSIAAIVVHQHDPYSTRPAPAGPGPIGTGHR
jgi:hypothetical protein